MQKSIELLEADEPGAYLLQRPQGESSFVIVVDHASRRIPRRLGDLGVPQSELQRHIAWDIGSLGVASRVSDALDAPLVAQNYSRLVIDCNRDPSVASSIPVLSEATPIPGNVGLGASQVAARRAALFDPYHARVRALLDQRRDAGRRTILVAQHSMTDNYLGKCRAMHVALLFNRDRRFADIVRPELEREPGIVVTENEPYFVSDENDYTIPTHAEKRGLPYVLIEIRQDLVADEAGQAAWAGRIARALRAAETTFWRDHG